ncbi:MAG TPA: hypothetical protein VF765_11155 [Polyangiaceae bacterium]
MTQERSVERETSWVLAAVRKRESDLADACAYAAVHLRDTAVAGRVARMVFEHLRHARVSFECTNPCAPEVETAVLRARAHRQHAHHDRVLVEAVDGAIAGAIARAHAEIALFVDDACGSLLVSPFERERLLRIAACTAALGASLD